VKGQLSVVQGKAEVGDFGFQSAIQQDVSGFEVTVVNAFGVSRSESAADGGYQTHRLIHRHHAAVIPVFLLQMLVQIASINVLLNNHRQITMTDNIKDANDSGVIDLRKISGLRPKAFQLVDKLGATCSVPGIRQSF
jgi:hypothetical protein